MLNPFKALLPAVAALSLTVPAFADGPTWFADFDEAALEAAKSGKDMLVDFTGSDWCVWCKRLDKEVFDVEAFQQGVEKDFVLVALDFPRDPEVLAAVPNPTRNKELMEEHGVSGFPTILLMNSAGEVYGRTGYRPGGAEAYVGHLGELRMSGKRELEAFNKLTQAYAAVEGEAKLTAWDELAGLAESLDSDSPFGARLVEPLKSAFTSDAANEQGRKLRATKALLAMGRLDADVQAAVLELDPANESGLREQALEASFGSVNNDTTARAAIESVESFESSAKFKDPQLAARLYASIAFWHAGALKEPEAAKPWARKALDLKPADDAMVAKLEEIVGG